MVIRGLFYPLFFKTPMKQVTISVTAPQALRLMQMIGHDGTVKLMVRSTRKKGKQHGGFLPILASLAAPLAGAIAGPLLNKGMNYLMGNGKPVCLTCTEKQFSTLQSQLGSGAQIAINFKIRSAGTRPSLNSQQAYHTLAGAGIFSTIGQLIGRLGTAAYSAITSNTARKIAGHAAGLGIQAASEKAKDYAKKRFATDEERQVAKPVAAVPAVPMDLFPSAPTNHPIANATQLASNASRYGRFKGKQRGNGLELAGEGMNLAGHGLRLAGRPANQKKFVIREGRPLRNTNGTYGM